MRKPRAKDLSGNNAHDAKPSTVTTTQVARNPQAFAPQNAQIAVQTPSDWKDDLPNAGFPVKNRAGWITRLALWSGGLLVSLGFALAADRLLVDLFARFEWLGWLGTALLGLFVLAILIIAVREFSALRSLTHLDSLRKNAAEAITTNRPESGRKILAELNQLYQSRPDLARARRQLDLDTTALMDGADIIHAAEQHLMSPLDQRAIALTAASARRVAVVTAISPRALVDIAFVAYESMKLARAIATIYGAKPGLFGAFRLAGAILGHLAITGGVALGDSVVQQLLGHGLAAKLSARLGEGLVNGLMSVRVGIAAMRVTRPLPYDRIKQPKVMDFMADLAKITKREAD